MRSNAGFWRGRRFAGASIAMVAALAMCVPSAGAAITTASDTAKIGSGTTGYVEVDCPGGSAAISSGFRVGGFSTVNGGILPTASRIRYSPSTSSSAFGVNSSGSDGTLTDYAYCDTQPRDIVMRFAAVPMEPDSSRTMTANCPSGTRVIGGGFVATYGNDSFVTYRSKKVRNGWRISVYNPPGAPYSSYVHSLASCQDHGPQLKTGVASATTNPTQYHGVATVEPSCPAATRPISGGFDGHVVDSPSPGVAPLVSRRLADSWRLSGWSVSPTVDATLTGYVYCEPL